MRQYRKLLLEKCLDSLREPVNTGVTSEGMEALAKILAELREGDMGSSFGIICEQCRAFFDNVSLGYCLTGPWLSGLGGFPKCLLSQRLSTSSPLKKRHAQGQKGPQVCLGADASASWSWDLVKEHQKPLLWDSWAPSPAVRV